MQQHLGTYLVPAAEDDRDARPVPIIIAFITDAAPIERILVALGEPAEPPRISPARGPPAREDAPEPMPAWDLLGQREPDVAFDQRIAW
jgi:hypothetical protein